MQHFKNVKDRILDFLQHSVCKIHDVQLKEISIWITKYVLFFSPILRKTLLFFPIPRAPGPQSQKRCIIETRRPLGFNEYGVCKSMKSSVMWTSFFHQIIPSWVIIRTEIKMTSCVIFSSNSPCVIDQSNLINCNQHNTHLF